MPTYEYECTKCGKVFDLFQPITEAPRKKLRGADPKPCKCNAPVLRRISTGGGLIFKGSGFYQTDYRSASYKSAAEKESKESGGKTDAKPAGESKPASDGSSAKPKSDSPKPKGDSATSN